MPLSEVHPVAFTILNSLNTLVSDLWQNKRKLFTRVLESRDERPPNASLNDLQENWKDIQSRAIIWMRLHHELRVILRGLKKNYLNWKHELSIYAVSTMHVY
jgi:hypothetical protein